MPKAYLVFDTVKEREALRMAQLGHEYQSVLWELDNELRNCVKHGTSKIAAKHAQKWRDRLLEMLRDSDISL